MASVRSIAPPFSRCQAATAAASHLPLFGAAQEVADRCRERGRIRNFEGRPAPAQIAGDRLEVAHPRTEEDRLFQALRPPRASALRHGAAGSCPQTQGPPIAAGCEVRRSCRRPPRPPARAPRPATENGNAGRWPPVRVPDFPAARHGAARGAGCSARPAARACRSAATSAASSPGQVEAPTSTGPSGRPNSRRSAPSAAGSSRGIATSSLRLPVVVRRSAGKPSWRKRASSRAEAGRSREMSARTRRAAGRKARKQPETPVRNPGVDADDRHAAPPRLPDVLGPALALREDHQVGIDPLPGARRKQPPVDGKIADPQGQRRSSVPGRAGSRCWSSSSGRPRRPTGAGPRAEDRPPASPRRSRPAARPGGQPPPWPAAGGGRQTGAQTSPRSRPGGASGGHTPAGRRAGPAESTGDKATTSASNLRHRAGHSELFSVGTSGAAPRSPVEIPSRVRTTEPSPCPN